MHADSITTITTEIFKQIKKLQSMSDKILGFWTDTARKLQLRKFGVFYAAENIVYVCMLALLLVKLSR